MGRENSGTSFGASDADMRAHAKTLGLENSGPAEPFLPGMKADRTPLRLKISKRK